MQLTVVTKMYSLQTSTVGLLKPPTLSPPPLTFRQFEKPPEDITPLSAKIITHNERKGSKTTTISEKVSIPTSTNKADKSANQEKGKIQRRCSWKVSRSSLRRKKNRSGSDSDAMPLNNGRDHSQCNGGGVQRHVSSFFEDDQFYSNVWSFNQHGHNNSTYRQIYT